MADDQDLNPDRDRVLASVTKEEIENYRAFLTQLKTRRPVPSNRDGERAKRQIEDWRKIADTSLATLNDANYETTEQWMLELRKSAAEGLAKGYGAIHEAKRLAPEIGLTLDRLKQAIERPDAERCICPPASVVRTQFVFSTKHNRIVAMHECATCGDWNAK